jgi:hypothetical protein
MTLPTKHGRRPLAFSGWVLAWMVLWAIGLAGWGYIILFTIAAFGGLD